MLKTKTRCEDEHEREKNTTSIVCGSFDQSLPMFGTQDRSEKRKQSKSKKLNYDPGTGPRLITKVDAKLEASGAKL